MKEREGPESDVGGEPENVEGASGMRLGVVCCWANCIDRCDRQARLDGLNMNVRVLGPKLGL